MNSEREIIESEWWKSLCKGDQSALQHLYMSYYKHLLQYGLRYTNDRDILKDNINSIFLYIWEKRETLAPAQHVGNYIFRSFQRQLIKDLKKIRTLDVVPVLNNEDDFYDSDEAQFILKQEENIRVNILKAAVLQLPKRQKELIILRYYEGLSYTEIAEKTQLTKRAVYNQIHTAITSLKKDAKLQDLKQILPLLVFF